MGFFSRELAAPAAAPGMPIEWEEVGCLLCGSPRWAPLIEAPDTAWGQDGLWFAIVQCQECGLCYTNPRPSTRSIGHFYPMVYRPHLYSRKRRRRTRYPRPGWGRPRNERQVLEWHGQGRLLDFGCGSGSFLDQMHHNGWQVTGIDVSAPTVRRIRAELGLQALIGTLPHPELQPDSFDVITMWHSLEHVHAPRTVLREAHQLLAPGGKLLVAVPNIDSLPFRWFGRNWFGLDLPRHLTHFTPWTLPLMLERAGFRAGPLHMVRHSDWLRSSAKLASRDRRSPYWYRWLTTKPVSRLATWYSFVTQQADCMIATAYKS
jgi:SAM-dependent methyltransferase